MRVPGRNPIDDVNEARLRPKWCPAPETCLPVTRGDVIDDSVLPPCYGLVPQWINEDYEKPEAPMLTEHRTREAAPMDGSDWAPLLSWCVFSEHVDAREGEPDDYEAVRRDLFTEFTGTSFVKGLSTLLMAAAQTHVANEDERPKNDPLDSLWPE